MSFFFRRKDPLQAEIEGLKKRARRLYIHEGPVAVPGRQET